MGTIIRKDAAAEDIRGDAQKTLTNAVARGGRWQELAEAKLVHVLALYASVETDLKIAEEAHAPHAAAISAQNERGDKIIGKNYDIIWNEVGRPAWDAALAVIFPDGIAYYAEGETDEQPDRMEILVQLLQKGMHPKLSKTTATACALEIDEAAQHLRVAVEAGAKTRAKVKVLGRVRTALAKVVHAELTALKRLYKAEGFTEAEIHAVIPDRPTKSAKPSGG